MTEIRMTATEIEQVAALVADKVLASIPPHPCQLTDDEVRFIRVATRTSASARATAFAAAVGIVTIGLVTAIGWGIIQWVQTGLARLH